MKKTSMIAIVIVLFVIVSSAFVCTGDKTTTNKPVETALVTTGTTPTTPVTPPKQECPCDEIIIEPNFSKTALGESGFYASCLTIYIKCRKGDVVDGFAGATVQISVLVGSTTVKTNDKGVAQYCLEKYPDPAGVKVTITVPCASGDKSMTYVIPK